MSLGYYKNGKRYEGTPPATNTSSQHKAYDQERQRREHKADLVQPWVDGQMNPEFEWLYPEESKLYKGEQNG